MNTDRDPGLLHPVLFHHLEAIQNIINNKLSAGHKVRLISAHRTPAQQFEIFKKGRAFLNGTWRIVNRGKVVTFKDGFSKLSNHNFLPSQALDFGIFSGNAYLPETPLYKKIGLGASAFNLTWGGNWTGFTDEPHIEIPPALLFKNNRVLDTGFQWQRYLKIAGTYTGELDGAFGNKSQEALKATTGVTERTVGAWKMLFTKFGPLPLL
jgi:D-alanyl-D-alanine carboxypeptidase